MFGVKKSAWLPWCVWMLALFIAAWLSPWVQSWQFQRAIERPMHLPSAVAMKTLSLGYRNAWSVTLWMRLLAYYGERLEKADFHYVADSLNAITMLNPGAVHAYIFSAVVLPWSTGDITDSSKLLHRAMKEMPDDWLWPFYQGFNYYWFAGDKASAASYLEHAARLPGAHPIVARLALRMRSEESGLDAALAVLDQLLEGQKDERIRRQLIKQRKAILTEKVLRQIDTLLDRLKARHNDQRDLRALENMGIRLPEMLPDGGRVRIGRDGRAVSSINPKRYGIYASPYRKRVH